MPTRASLADAFAALIAKVQRPQPELEAALGPLTRAEVPMAPPTTSTVPRVAGKSLADRLGDVLSAEGDRRTTRLPARMRLTTYDPASGSVQLTGLDKGNTISTSASDLDTLMRQGAVNAELPPGAREGQTISQLIARLRKLLQ